MGKFRIIRREMWICCSHWRRRMLSRISWPHTHCILFTVLEKHGSRRNSDEDYGLWAIQHLPCLMYGSHTLTHKIVTSTYQATITIFYAIRCEKSYFMGYWLSGKKPIRGWRSKSIAIRSYSYVSSCLGARYLSWGLELSVGCKRGSSLPFSHVQRNSTHFIDVLAVK